MMREKMSRPNASVPHQCSHEGGMRIEAKSISSGFCGATHPEKMPANIMTKIMTKLTAPNGCCRQKSRNALGTESAGAGATGTSIVIGASVIADPRIEHGVEQIHREIDEDVERGDQHHHALYQREVVARDALHEQFSDAVEIEHLLGDHQAADQEGEFEPDDGDGGKQRVAQRVARDDQPLVDALGARGADIVFAEHFE